MPSINSISDEVYFAAGYLSAQPKLKTMTKKRVRQRTAEARRVADSIERQMAEFRCTTPNNVDDGDFLAQWAVEG